MEYGSLVSVVMPVYNRAHLMPRVLGSLCAQSYKNLEILVVDDCSSDDIEGAIAAFDDPRIKLVRRAQNGGVAAARNTGVEAATGRYIAFHDSDDYCVVDRIELTMRLLTSLPDDYVGAYGARLIYNEASEDNYKAMDTFMRPYPGQTPLSGDLAARTVQGNIINFPTMLVKADALRAAGPSDELLRKNVDWDLALRLTQQGKFGFVPEPLILTPTSMDPTVSANRVSRSKRQGARSYARITRKLRTAGHTGPSLAHHYATTGLYLMQNGRPLFARRYFKAALEQNRSKLRTWAHLGLSYMPGVYDKVRAKSKL